MHQAANDCGWRAEASRSRHVFMQRGAPPSNQLEPPSLIAMAATQEPVWTAADTAAAQEGLIHLNSAGCSLPSRAVLQATVDYLQK